MGRTRTGLLTENVLALAATVRDINGGLRERLALEVEGDGPPALDLEPESLPAPRRGQGRLTTPGAG
jgi:hypothetical protein